MKKILLLGTGGTIACKRTPDGLKPVITSEEILTYRRIYQISFNLAKHGRSRSCTLCQLPKAHTSHIPEILYFFS